MNKLNLFNFEGNEIRTNIDEENSAWFAGVDVCSILGYLDTTQALEKLDDDEKKLDRIDHGSGQKRKTWTVNEFGLYTLILSSTKPEAKAFKRWVTHEVLPAIRKAGIHSSEEQAEKERNLQRLHREIGILEAKRSDINKDIRAIREQFNEMLYTDPNQLKIQFNK